MHCLYCGKKAESVEEFWSNTVCRECHKTGNDLPPAISKFLKESNARALSSNDPDYIADISTMSYVVRTLYDAMLVGESFHMGVIQCLESTVPKGDLSCSCKR